MSNVRLLMALSSTTPKSPSLRGQVATCALLCSLAIGTTLLFHDGPAFDQWQSGQAVVVQIAVVVGAAVLGFVGLFVALRLPFLMRRVKVAPNLAAMDLSGYKPLAIALAAGVGEELLFRAALLPVVGLWLSSALFAVAHVGTAQLVATKGRRVAYLFQAGNALHDEVIALLEKEGKR